MEVTASLTERRWVLRQEDVRAGLGLAQRLGVPEVVGRLLAARGLDGDGAAEFLRPTLRALLPDPSVLLDMDPAAERLAAAVRRGETVGIFGDYDVDGACSAAVMALLLSELGCPVLTHVPDRLTEGYGPNAPALQNLVVRGAGLIVCVDCGTTAGDVLAAVRGRADVVVLDHHAAADAPAVLATVNPNRVGDGSGLGGLCAAGVAFLAAVAAVRVLRRGGWFAGRAEPDLLGLLDLVALATVCDVMPLTGLNRALVTQGLRVMARRARPGVAALLEVAGVRGVPDAWSCGFGLGPRLNATGRLDDAGLGLRLLLCADPVEARGLAAILDAVNAQRRDVEQSVLDEAHGLAAAQAEAGHAALFVSGADWHPGVVGIVAGRVKERHNRPSLVGARMDGRIQGSGRSVPGVDLGAAVTAARAAGLLQKGGGHAMAAGFTMALSREAEFHAFLNERLAHASALPRVADLAVAGSVGVAGATVELAQEVGRLAPFGAGNPEPVFALPRARVVRADRIGKDGQTVRAYVEGEGSGPRLKAMVFRGRDERLVAALERPGAPLHLAGYLRAEEWQGTVSACFTVVDAAVA